MRTMKKMLALLLGLAMITGLLPVMGNATSAPTSVIDLSAITYGWGGNTTPVTYYAVSDSSTTNGLNYTGIYGRQAANVASYTHFTEAGIARIQAYAAANGFDTLRVGIQKTKNGGSTTPSNGGNVYDTTTESKVDYVANDGSNSYFKTGWKYWDFAVADLTVAFPRFNLQAETTVCEINMTFEFVNSPVVTASDITYGWGTNTTAVTYRNAYDCNTTNGLNYTGVSGQQAANVASYTHFTAAGITKIQAYAAANGFDTLRVGIQKTKNGGSTAPSNGGNVYDTTTESKVDYVANDGSNSYFKTGWKYWDFAVEDLTVAFPRINLQSETTVCEVNLTFEFVSSPVVTATDITYGWGTNTTAVTYRNVYDCNTTYGLVFTGVSGRQAANVASYTHFTAAGITKIQAYAAANGYDTIRIGIQKTKNGGSTAPSNGGNVYDTTTGSKVDLAANDGTNSYFKTGWKYWDFTIDDLTEAFPRINLQSETTVNEVNMTFEFIRYIDSWQVSLGDDIGADFFVGLNGYSAANTTFSVTVNGETTNYVASSLTPDEEGLYQVPVNLNAVQMNDPITVSTIVNGVERESKTYTIRQYADYILAGDYNETTKTMVKAMLHYGAAAQTFFEYNDSNLANAGVAAIANQTIPDDAPGLAKSGTMPSGLTIYAASLVLRSKTVVRYYFKTTGDINDYTFTNANAEIITPFANGNYYCVDIEGINPYDLDQDAIVNATDGVTAISIGYSPLRYMVDKKNDSDPDLVALVQALYNYYVAAEAYTA